MVQHPRPRPHSLPLLPLLPLLLLPPCPQLVQLSALRLPTPLFRNR